MKPKSPYPDNLQMVDFAARDPRSYSRMLRGFGDGRENIWLEFRQKYGAFFTESELHAVYRHHCNTTPPAPDNHLGKILLAALVIFAIVF